MEQHQALMDSSSSGSPYTVAASSALICAWRASEANLASSNEIGVEFML